MKLQNTRDCSKLAKEHLGKATLVVPVSVASRVVSRLHAISQAHFICSVRFYYSRSFKVNDYRLKQCFNSIFEHSMG